VLIDRMQWIDNFFIFYFMLGAIGVLCLIGEP